MAKKKTADLKKGDTVLLVGHHAQERGTIAAVHEGGHLADVDLSGGRQATIHTSNLQKVEESGQSAEE